MSAPAIIGPVAELIEAITALRDLHERTPADDNSKRFWAANEAAWSRVDDALANLEGKA